MKYKILDVLKKTGDYVSGEYLSEILGVTRSAVWKNINALRDEGYVIDSVTNKGYLLASSSDKIINAYEIKSNLSADIIGCNVRYFDTVGSTNDEAKKAAGNGAPSGTVIAASAQTSGKGRLGRSWVSPPAGGLYFSVIVRPDISPYDAAGMTLAAGLCTCLALRNRTGLDCKIKWPNDIIIGNKKICGILTEMSAQTDKIDYAVIGIGINVLNRSFPEEISHKASSLFIESGGTEFSKTEIICAVLNELDKHYSDLTGGFSESFIDIYKTLCATLDRNISVIRGGKEIIGKAISINSRGELVVLCNGELTTVNSGEVTVQGIY